MTENKMPDEIYAMPNDYYVGAGDYDADFLEGSTKYHHDRVVQELKELNARLTEVVRTYRELFECYEREERVKNLRELAEKSIKQALAENKE